MEEYVRAVEPNDHMKWIDDTYNGETYSFIARTKNKVSEALSKYLSGDVNPDSKRKMSELGKIYSWILPPEDFGKRPTSGSGTSGGSGNPTRSHRKMKYSIVSHGYAKQTHF